MKKILFSFALTFTFLGTSFALTDIFPDYRFYPEVWFVNEMDIAKGYADESFQPEKKINRAEFIKIIIGAAFEEEEIKNCTISAFSFWDVPQNEWYAPYVCIAKKKGIINGYKDGSFHPNENISLPEAMKIILSVGEVDIYSQYPGNPSKEQWYEIYNFYFSNGFFHPEKFPNFSFEYTDKVIIPNFQLVSHKVSRGEMAYFLKFILYGEEDLQCAYYRNEFKEEFLDSCFYPQKKFDNKRIFFPEDEQINDAVCTKNGNTYQNPFIATMNGEVVEKKGVCPENTAPSIIKNPPNIVLNKIVSSETKNDENYQYFIFHFEIENKSDTKWEPRSTPFRITINNPDSPSIMSCEFIPDNNHAMKFNAREKLTGSCAYSFWVMHNDSEIWKGLKDLILHAKKLQFSLDFDIKTGDGYNDYEKKTSIIDFPNPFLQ